MKLHPRCVHGGRDPAFNIKGYFLPCCWVDNRLCEDDFEYLGFFHEDFHIDNLHTPDDVKAVFESDEWKFFYNMVVNNPERAPSLCKRHCQVIDGEITPSTKKFADNGRDIGQARNKLLDLIDVKVID